jgi:hypothetical protein
LLLLLVVGFRWRRHCIRVLPLRGASVLVLPVLVVVLRVHQCKPLGQDDLEHRRGLLQLIVQRQQRRHAMLLLLLLPLI